MAEKTKKIKEKEEMPKKEKEQKELRKYIVYGRMVMAENAQDAIKKAA